MMTIQKNKSADLQKTSAAPLKSLLRALSARVFTYYTVLRSYLKLINIGPDRGMGLAGQAAQPLV